MKRSTNAMRSFAGSVSSVRYVSRSARRASDDGGSRWLLLRLIGRKEEQPLAAGLPSDVRARREDRDRRQPAPHLFEVLELADPIDGADEDVL